VTVQPSATAFKPRDFRRAARFLADRLGALQARLDHEDFDRLEQSVKDAERLDGIEARMAALVELAIAHGFQLQEGAA
jgi:hypothetical protein